MLPLLIVISVIGLVSSRTTCEHNGRSYYDGDSWDERGMYRMRCEVSPSGSWKTVTTGCLVDGILVRVGEHRTMNGIRYSCKQDHTGYTQLSRQNQEPSYQETWEQNRDPSYQRPIQRGDRYSSNSRPSDRGDYGTGPVELSYDRSELNDRNKESSIRCIDKQGRERQSGDQWVESNVFQKRCLSNGEVRFEGCIAKGRSIEPNSWITIDGKQHHCEIKPNGQPSYYTGGRG